MKNVDHRVIDAL